MYLGSVRLDKIKINFVLYFFVLVLWISFLGFYLQVYQVEMLQVLFVLSFWYMYKDLEENNSYRREDYFVL